ncbi:MAG: hypothetical protein ACJAT3_002265 [Akkermansiaceae bacterium]|jgi:hypothetical protein
MILRLHASEAPAEKDQETPQDVKPRAQPASTPHELRQALALRLRNEHFCSLTSLKLAASTPESFSD